MLLVPTYLAPSPIHGLGVFATERIARGTLMWRFQPGLDQIIPFQLISELPSFVQAYLRRYTFASRLFPGGAVLLFDHSRYINHSANPNTDNSTEYAYAEREIAKNEEITCNYDEFCDEYDLND